jgi:8-oxo-dGTP diphosphatase
MRPVRTSAKAIILHDGKLLALKFQDDKGYWYELPGGGQEPGETLPEAVRRECLEEAGADVEVGELMFVRDYIGKNHEFANQGTSATFHQVELMFACTMSDPTQIRVGLVPDTCQVSVEWLALEKLDRYRLYPLALRPLIATHRPGTPVYLGDVN